LSSPHKPELWEQYCETMVESKSLRVAQKEYAINLTTGKARKQGNDKPPKVKVVIGIGLSGHIADHVVGHFTLAQLKVDFLSKFADDLVL